MQTPLLNKHEFKCRLVSKFIYGIFILTMSILALLADCNIIILDDRYKLAWGLSVIFVITVVETNRAFWDARDKSFSHITSWSDHISDCRETCWSCYCLHENQPIIDENDNEEPARSLIMQGVVNRNIFDKCIKYCCCTCMESDWP